MDQGKSDQQIGYILRSYPRLTQTFILNEVLALEKIGVPLEIFAITHPQEEVVQPKVSQVKARVRYLDQKGERAKLALGPRYYRALRYVEDNELIDQGYTAASRMECFYQAVQLVQLLQERAQEGQQASEALGSEALGSEALDSEARDGDSRAARAGGRIRHSGGYIRHLHAHFAHDPALVAQLAHMMTGIPFSFTAHARDLYQVPAPVLLERIRMASHVVTCCRTNLEYLEEIAPGERGKFSVVYHGVDVESFHPAEEQPAGGGVPLILTVSRLVEKKGLLDLFQALKQVKDGGERFRCEVYGDGPMEAALRQWITEQGMDEEIRLMGTTTQDQLLPVYRRAAMFALASTVTDDGDRDGIPNSLAEAMAVGLPVVTTAVGGIPELVQHRQEGFLVQPHDIAGLAGGIAALLSDEQMRAAMGRAARRRVVEQFNIARSAVKLKELFDSVFAPSAQAGGKDAAIRQVTLTHEP